VLDGYTDNGRPPAIIWIEIAKAIKGLPRVPAASVADTTAATAVAQSDEKDMSSF